jgi:hypothetical protein
MHGLTGGSRKRSVDLTMVMEKNGPAGNRKGIKWLHDLQLADATAPAPDPPSYVVGELFPASGQSSGNSEGWGEGCPGARSAYRGGSGCADGGQNVSGAES